VFCVAFRKGLQRLATPTEELDRQALTEFCALRGFTPMDQLVARTRVATGGEVKSVRIVPRAGAPALEVTLADGRGSATAVFLGRRKIAGLAPGKRIAVSGMVARDGKQFLFYNPEYSFVS
jgi:RecG-like helicase